jgi:DNA-binding transcriptional MerR regulator
MFSIGGLSRRSGVKVPTIRYYEQIGLIAAPGRTAGNQRRYRDPDLERLTFIRHARDLGLPIDAIRQLLDLSDDPGRDCAEADRIVGIHLDQVRDRIARLRRLERELERIAMQCAGGAVRDCYVIAALADHDLCAGGH